jgi:tRNA(fMet)-specific endonuclease VapC
MSFLLDTDVSSAFLKNVRGLAHRFVQHSGRLYLPTIVLGELYTWAYRRPDPAPTLQAIESGLLPQVKVLVFDGPCAHEFGRLRALLLKSGRSVPTVDAQIAATALAHDLTVVTHNIKDYCDIPGLQISDWLGP